MDTGFWSRYSRQRISRRHALGAMGAAAGAAAFLAACGDDDDGGSTGATGGTGGGASTTGPAGGAGSSGLLITPTDQTASAKKGGTLNIAENVATASLEQSLNVGGSGSGGRLIPHIYSQLMLISMGDYNNVPQGQAEPELAESFEIADEGRTVTFKLREAKFDERPPTNGRMLTAEDVKFSWERWEANNPRAPELSNNKHPDAPVIRVETPDARTAVFRLAFPFAPFMAYLSSSFFPFIYPKEAEDGYDTRAIGRGTGPYIIENESPSDDKVLKRNPNYYHDKWPMFETIHIHNITEYSTIYAQFIAGALDYSLLLQQEDVLLAKKDRPDLVMYQRPFFAKGCGGVFFGRRPGSPFNDDRVRWALSMGLDRELWGDTYSNRAKFESEGLPVDVAWPAGAGPGYHWWLDPQKNELGEASKHLQFLPEEAHKMLEATGLELPIRTTWNASPGSAQGEVDHPGNQGMFGLFAATGDFEFDIKVTSDFTEYLETVRNTHGDFEGVGLAFYFDHHDYDWTLYLRYHPSSTDFWMGIAGEDPKITDLVNAQRRELDTTKREAVFQEFIKYDMERLNYIPHFPADWKPYYIGQPWIGGWGWYQPYIEQYPNGPGQVYHSYWFDESKKAS